MTKDALLESSPFFRLSERCRTFCYRATVGHVAGIGKRRARLRDMLACKGKGKPSKKKGRVVFVYVIVLWLWLGRARVRRVSEGDKERKVKSHTFLSFSFLSSSFLSLSPSLSHSFASLFLFFILTTSSPSRLIHSLFRNTHTSTSFTTTAKTKRAPR